MGRGIISSDLRADWDQTRDLISSDGARALLLHVCFSCSPRCSSPWYARPSSKAPSDAA